MVVAEYADLGAAVVALLRASAGVCALVSGGADGIVEGYDLDAQTLEAAQKARTPGQVLAVQVIDMGEVQGGGAVECDVFLNDRRQGFTAIRAARAAVYAAVLNKPALLADGAAAVMIKRRARDGQLYLPQFDLNYERVRLYAPLTFDDGADRYGL